MASMNKVILLGYLTRDPAMSYLPSQTPVVEFGLAMNRKWKGQDGQQNEDVCFVDCKAFGKTAETLNQYMSKGMPLLVEGRLHLDQWEDKDSGQKRSKLRVIIERFTFMGGSDGDDTQKRDEQPAPAMGGSQEQPPPVDDSIPPPIAPQPAPAQADPTTPWDPNVAYEKAAEQGGDTVPF